MRVNHAGIHDKRNAAPPQLRRENLAGAILQPCIENSEIGRVGRQPCESTAATREGPRDAIAAIVEFILKHHADHGFVFNDENEGVFPLEVPSTLGEMSEGHLDTRRAVR